jgi:uncharacterized membrane protein YgcG
MILPKLLTRILSRDTFQDLCAARVLIYEFRHIVHRAVDDDVHALFRGGFGGDFGGGECFGHGGFCRSGGGGRDRWVCEGFKLFGFGEV